MLKHLRRKAYHLMRMTSPVTSPVNSPAVFPATSKVRFYVPQLDGLRFFAFLLVFFHHMNGMSEIFGRNTIGGKDFGFIELWGWCGVDLFLVLSAYLITTLLLIEHEREGAISLRGFYLRRRGHTFHPYIWTHTLSRLDPLLMGIALALWRKSHPLHPGWLVPIIKFTTGIVAVWAVSMGAVIETQSLAVVWQFFATAFGFVLILDAILSNNRNPLAWLFSGRPFVWLGKLTYGLYVYHILGIQFGRLLSDWARPQRWIKSNEGVIALRLIVAFVLTVLIAAISYRFFESFFLRLKDKFSRIKSRPVGKVVP